MFSRPTKDQVDIEPLEQPKTRWQSAYQKARRNCARRDLKSGGELWVVEAIAPFGGPEEMIKNLKSHVFPDKELRYLALNAEGKKEVRVL
jgi:hemolysin-activating ACP:hemolysin acyltransferase